MGKPLGPLGQLLVQALATKELKRQLPRIDEPVSTRLEQLLRALEKAEENDSALKWEGLALGTSPKTDVLH